jgi:chromosome segregation protein
MQWAELDESSAEQRHQIGENEVALEASITRQREIDTSIEKSRTAHQESTDAFNGVQARYYSLGADIARIEQTIQHQQERYKQLTGDLEQTRSSVTELDNSLRHDKDKLEQYQEELLEVEPMLEELEAMEEQTAIALEEAEVAMQEWQGQWDEFNGESSKATREAEVQQSRIQHIDRSRESLQQRINRLEAEAPNLAGDSDENDLVQLTAQLAEAELRSEQLEDSSRGLSAEVEQCRNNLHESSEDLNRVRSDVQRLRGKQSSLEALQQAARGGKGEGSGRWLAAQGLDNVARLGENLQVESGWETAVETVLGNYLQAVSLDDWAVLNDSGLDFDSGSLTLLSPADSAVASSGQAGLLSKVSAKTDIDLESLLHGVGFADTLSDALARRAQLAAGESIVTRDGIWLGRSWLRVARDSDAQAGIIRRQAELEEVEAGLAQAQEQEEQLQQQVAEWRETLQQQERDLANQQRELGECARSLGDFRAQIGSKRARLEEFARRRERNAAELVEHREQFGIESEQLAEARETLQLALDEMEANDHRRNELLGSRDQLRQSLDSARSSVRQHKDQHHQQALRCQSLKSQIIAAQEAISRMSAQAEQLRTRQLALEESLSETEDPMNISTASLDELLEKRLLVEEELGESRRTLEQVEAEMRQLEEQRVDAENKTQDLRGKLERLRLETQTIRVKQEGLIEQLRESQHDLQGVLGTLTEENTLQERQELLELIGRRIQRLGAINLAAIEEYQQQLERKTYLDAQNDELEEALETLENAIRKIDRETRTRFKDTFDQINKGLGELFPKVFGGGHAYLELTGEDLLDTGVAIMARPPGKRNSTIHLLSGGEKALTAIALVFSIFQLTPAPFCMLDEVDAPLDDANVGRYARMVEEMSAKIQFIYITHNKIAMEMAKQLMGVTMHEPGASRLVSVDVDQAAEMVAV